MTALSPRDLARFDRDGYLVIEAFTTGQDCQSLQKRAGQLVAQLVPETGSPDISIFRAHQDSLNNDTYFLESGDKIRCFFEEDAWDASGNLIRPPSRAINKIGHALHDLDPTFAQFSRSPEVCAVVAQLGMKRPLALQSMYIFKQPCIGGEVAYHQDATYLYTDPISVIGLWWALEDATLENGCLWAWPGGHRTALKSRVLRSADDTVRREIYDTSPWPEKPFVPLPVPRGTLILLHGLLPHGSGPNRSSTSRHAYALHIIDGACHYPADNWLQRGSDMPLFGFADNNRPRWV